MKYIGALNSADKLTVPRDIAGSAFDGTADIDIDFDELVDKPSLGTAAARNAPASGNAGAAEVVLGNDTRLTDARPANGGNAATVTTNANLTGQVTSVGNATSIAANVVTNSKLAQVSTQTVKGRLTAGSGNVEDITISDLRTAIGTTYTLPTATAGALGGIKVGSGLAIDSGTGILSATGTTATYYQEFIATGGQTVFNLSFNVTARSGNLVYLQVYKNGIFQQENGKSYNVTSAAQITFLTACDVGDDIAIFYRP